MPRRDCTSSGRWTQQDPVGGSVGKVGSGNAYVYADDAPVMRTDPGGKFTCQGNIGMLVASIVVGDFAVVVADLAVLSIVDTAAIGAILLGFGGVIALALASLIVVVTFLDQVTTTCLGAPLF